MVYYLCYAEMLKWRRCVARISLRETAMPSVAWHKTEYAEVAQVVEQLTRNEQVVGSSPIFSSTSEQALYACSDFFAKFTARSCRCSSFPSHNRRNGL